MTQTAERIEAVQRQAQWDYEGTLDWIKSDARNLISQMERLVKQVEAAQAGESYSINSLGEVQSYGRDIDRNCAILYEQAKAIKAIDYITKDGA